jgi:hypothetical protein
MPEIHYYNPYIAREIIDKLCGRIVHRSAVDGVVEGSVFSGAYMLSACFYSIPDYAVQDLYWLEGYYKKYSNVEIFKGAERCIRDKTSWVHAVEPCGLDEYFSIVLKSAGINTFQFLLNCCVHLFSRPGERIHPFLKTGLNALVNRFERSGRLYISYDNRFRPVTEEFAFLYNYPLLSILLLKMFEIEGDLKYLSTSLKAIDLIPFIIDHIHDVDISMAVLSSVFLGENVLRGFYDTKKFRLSANR